MAKKKNITKGAKVTLGFLKHNSVSVVGTVESLDSKNVTVKAHTTVEHQFLISKNDIHSTKEGLFAENGHPIKD